MVADAAYRPRNPEESLLYQVVAGEFETFLAAQQIRIRRHVAMKNDRAGLIENADTWFERANQFRSNADVVTCKISLGLLLIFVALRGRLSHLGW